MASYAPERSKNLRKHREENTSKRPVGNTARQIEEIRKKNKKKESKQVEIPFGDQSHNIAPENQPFASQHD